MYQVCDNNNVVNVYHLGGLIDAASGSKKFYFCRSNIDCMMESLNDRIIVDMDISNWGGYLSIIILLLRLFLLCLKT